MFGLAKAQEAKEQAMTLVNARLIKGISNLAGTRVTHGGGPTDGIMGVMMFRRVAAALGMVIAASLAGIAPASAAQVSTAPGPQLVCSVLGGTTGTGRCSALTHSPTNSYGVLFTLTSVSASEVKGWNVPYQNVSSSGADGTCVAGQLKCWVVISPADADPVSVTVTVSFNYLQGIFPQQRTATVTVPGRCPAAC
jgi:hypothetical protein